MLEVREVSKIYGMGAVQVKALDGVSLKVDKGEYIAVMGPSGSGKSTLLNVIGGLDTITSGEVRVAGVRIDNMDENDLVSIRRGKIAYIFQQYHLLPSLTALENVLLPLTFGNIKGKDDRAMSLLETVGLSKRAHHKPNQLSGGEQQRVAIARALVNEPLLLLADEPTGNMDEHNGNEIMNLFDKLNREGHTIIMVTHNPDAAKHAGKLIKLKDGQIIDQISRVDKSAA